MFVCLFVLQQSGEYSKVFSSPLPNSVEYSVETPARLVGPLVMRVFRSLTNGVDKRSLTSRGRRFDFRCRTLCTGCWGPFFRCQTGFVTKWLADCRRWLGAEGCPTRQPSTFWKGLPGPQGRPDHKNRSFPDPGSVFLIYFLRLLGFAMLLALRCVCQSIGHDGNSDSRRGSEGRQPTSREVSGAGAPQDTAASPGGGKPQNRFRPNSGPEDRFPARKHYCVT